MRLANLVEKSAIILNYEARDAEDVVTMLGKCLEDSGYVRESFVKAALKREESMPTGLPLSGSANAAIPHTDVEHVLQAGVALATLKNTVTFQNMANPEESVDVRLVLLLALDKPKAQIEMLQEIAGILQDSNLIEQFLAAQSPEAILKILRKET
jgi:PTS system galactitol-specific IIA component